MSERIWQRPHSLIMAVLAASAVIVGYLVLPGDRERIAMLERDGKNREALAILENRFAQGDRSATTLYQLQGLLLHFGALDQSRRMLEQLAQERPRDANIQRRLAAFYKDTQDETAYAKALEARIQLRDPDAACRELIGLYRLRGNFDAERGALQTCRQLGYRRAEDLVRLASLLATSNEMGQAAAILRSIDDLRRLKSNQERMTLFAALLELEQPREALRRSVRWLKGTRDEEFALSLIEMLADENRHEVAMQLAREVGEAGSSVALAVAEIMLERQQFAVAASYLRGWLADAKLEDPVLVERFVAAALDAEDPDIAFQAAQRFGLLRLNPDDLISLAEALGASGKTAEFDILRAQLTPEQLGANPLLRAAVALRSGTPEQSRVYLQQVRVDQLDEWRLSLWARLMEQTGNARAVPPGLRAPGVQAPQAEQKRVAEPARVANPKIIRQLKKTRTLSNRLRRPAGAPIVARPPAADATSDPKLPQKGG